MKRRAGRWTLLLALVVVTAGCTSSVTGAARPVPVVVPLSPSAGATVVADAHLTVSVPEAAVTEDTTLSARPSAVAPPAWPGFVSAAAPVDISVGARLNRPATLTFDGKDGPEGALPVLLHHDDELGWYLVEVGDPGGPVVAQRTGLSPFLAGWLTPALGWLGDRLTGRGTPVTCGPAPEWAKASGPKVDVVSSCLTTDSGQAALKVRNNRALPVEIVLPRDVKSTVDRAEALGKALAQLSGGGGVVLFQGEELTARWPRPAQSAEQPVLARFTAATQLTGVVVELLGIKDLSGWAGLAAYAYKCYGKGAPASVPEAFAALVECLSPLTTPQGSAAAAVSTIAQINGISEVVAAGDRAFSPDVDRLANGLRALGKVLKFHTAAKLVVVLDQAARDSAAPDADRSVIVRLTGSAPAMDTRFVGQWGQHAGGLQIQASLTGQINYQVQSEGLPKFFELGLRFEAVGTGALRAIVTRSDDPATPVGKVLGLQLAHPGIIITGLRQENSRWCNPVTRQNNECGA